MHLHCTPVVPLSTIHERWRLRNAIFDQEYKAAPQKFEIKRSHEVQIKAINHNDKFKHVKRLCSDISEAIPVHGTKTFKKMLESLNSFKEIVLNGAK